MLANLALFMLKFFIPASDILKKKFVLIPMIVSEMPPVWPKMLDLYWSVYAPIQNHVKLMNCYCVHFTDSEQNETDGRQL